MTLCQDTDYIVRINMCDGLHCLAAAVGLDVTVATILPEIFELMKDEEPLVRVAAVNSLVAGTHTQNTQRCDITIVWVPTVNRSGSKTMTCLRRCVKAFGTSGWLLQMRCRYSLL